ncbi:MAG: ATP-binding cassette domain-containing protein [Alphaproteobacteria bacterium]|nr:ATP-binding cassette domain-containing protein [Alphaproteobacteria bacterium]
MTTGAPTKIVLDVDRVAKRYYRNPLSSQRQASRVLFEAMLGRTRENANPQPGEITVVRDVSFTLRRGEAIGIIGGNGAGKTTMLRMLAGHVLPDAGAIRVYGTTGSMIDLTSGIKDTMSGRANIFLRSAILGRRRKDVEADLEEIIDYTELGAAIDAPVATYSSGMRMRLAFATTMFMRPDVLLVDEVLSVGDFRFRQKCLESIRMMRENAGFVLVSHSMGDVSRFCDRVLVLKGGAVAFDGAPDDAIAFYYDQQDRAAKKPKLPAAPVGAASGAAARPRYGDYIERRHLCDEVEARWLSAEGEALDGVRSGDRLRLRLSFRLLAPVRRLIVGVPIFGRDGEMVTALSSEQAGFAATPGADGRVEIEIDVPELRLTPGVYKAVLALHDGPEYLYRQLIGEITVVRGGLPKYWGSLVTPQRWSQTQGRVDAPTGARPEGAASDDAPDETGGRAEAGESVRET